MSDIEARRAERKAQLAEAEKKQRDDDLEFVDALEQELGDSNVGTLELPYTPGLPVLLAVRCPTPVEMKRYRDTAKTKKNGDSGDALKAAQDLATVCLKYPDRETYFKCLAARPGIDAQIGACAVRLALGREEQEGKD